MKLTTFTDYNLRVLMYLATQPERRATVAGICAAFDIKPNHVAKVVHHLARCGWVETTRGKGGGLALARLAEQISVGQVVRDAEGAAQPAECFSAEDARHDCAIARSCRLKGVLAEAVDAFHAVLDRYTLADITRNREVLAAVLHFHPARAA
jgi:Rrf2 family nitric oxide-sensitive transcriptional repressor